MSKRVRSRVMVESVYDPDGPRVGVRLHLLWLSRGGFPHRSVGLTAEEARAVAGWLIAAADDSDARSKQ